MRNKLLLVIALIWMIATWTTASTAVNTSEALNPEAEFERIHGPTCSVATDGCNTFKIKNWKIFAWTKKLCNKPVTWYCTKQKINNELLTQTETWLSFNDLNFHKKITKSLWKKYINKIDKSVQDYKKRIEEKRNLEQILKLNNKIEAKIEKKIWELLMKYPQDISLPKKANKRYFVLKYLSFELQKYWYYIQKEIDTPKMDINTLN